MKLLLLLLAASAAFAQTCATHCVILTWTASPSPNVANYNVKRSTVSGGPYSTIGSTVGLNFTDNATATNLLAEGATFFYVVTAANAGGESVPSTEANAKIPVSIPLPPTALTAVPK